MEKHTTIPRQLFVEPGQLIASYGFLCRLLYSLNNTLPYAIYNLNSRSMEKYCRTAKATLVATIAVSALMPAAIGYILFHPPLYIIVLSAVIGAIAIGLPVHIVTASWLPVALYKNRGAVLESKFLPFATSLALLLQSGLQLSEAFKHMYDRMRVELPEFNLELEYIKSNIELGRPLDRVLVEAAMITPSPSLKALLLSLSRAARMGLHAGTIVQHAIRNYLSTYTMLAEKTTTSLGFIFEVYISVGLIVPIIVGILALLAAIYPVMGIGMDALLALTTFILIPLVSIVTLISADSAVSKLRL